MFQTQQICKLNTVFNTKSQHICIQIVISLKLKRILQIFLNQTQNPNTQKIENTNPDLNLWDFRCICLGEVCIFLQLNPSKGVSIPFSSERVGPPRLAHGSVALCNDIRNMLPNK